MVYSLTVRNQGSKDIRDVVLWTSDGAHSPPYEIEDGLGCAAENRGWNQQDSTPATDYNYEVWERFLGLLRPGQAVTVPFCVEIPAKDPIPFFPICLDLVKYFWVNGHPRGIDSGGLGPKLDTALVRHLPSGCALRAACLSGELGAGGPCCVAEAIHCLFHPSDSLCTGVPSSTAGAAVGRLTSGGVAAAKYFEAMTDLGRLYVLRGSVLAATPGGRGVIALYDAHQAELKRRLLPDPALRQRAIDVITTWRPILDGLIGPRSDSPRITAAQVAELESFLAELRVGASPALRAAIDRESQALDLDAFVDLSADQGLQRLNKLTCSPGPTTLCLSAGRVRIETEWETRDGQRGSGHAVALTGDTGTFWFFDAASVETIVKVLDACTYNDRRWIFAAGLTDVRVVTTATDTATGAVRTYTNPLGRPFAPLQDTSAFACSP